MKTVEERREAMKARQERAAQRREANSPAARREKMQQRQADLKAKRTLKMTVAKLGTLSVFEPDDEAEPVTVENLDEMNAAVAQLADEKFSDEQKARIDDYRKGRERINMIRERQADSNHYFVMCFQTQGQCDAFLNALKSRGIIPTDQDLFVDGRLVAPHVGDGIKLPDPEYPMDYTPQKANGPSSRMEKIPRGYS